MNPLCVGCHAGQQELQSKVEKSASGMNCSNEHQYDPRDIELPKCDPIDLPSPNVTRKKDRNGREANIEKSFIHFVTLSKNHVTMASQKMHSPFGKVEILNIINI